jgi:cytochrome c
VTAARLLRCLRGVASLVAITSLASCRDVGGAEARAASRLTGGDPARGRVLMRTYGCQTCHTIPGVVGADGSVGPPLSGVASRSYIGGVLVNAPENMVRWIQNPKSVDPLTAMPNVGVTPSDARHIAAYLYTLR